MNISLFEIIILLLIFIPLIKRVLDSMKPVDPADDPDLQVDPWETEVEKGAEAEYRPHGESGRRTYQADDRTASESKPQTGSGTRREIPSGEQSWEDFFEGLEKVISGDEPETVSKRGDTRGQSVTDRPHATQQSMDSTRSTTSGETYRHPSHGPVFGDSKSGSPEKRSSQRSSGATRSTRSANTGQYKNFGEDIGKQEKELAGEDNPIYATLDEAPTVTYTGTTGRKNVKRILGNPEKLREGIMLKVILDPPKSRRGHTH